MKTNLRAALFSLLAVLIFGGIAVAANTLGNKGVRIHDIAWDCGISADPYYGVADNTGSCSHSWSSLTTSTSEAITATGARVGDSCSYVPGVTVAATAQALDFTCIVSAANTATLRVSNASGGALTPTTGRRGVMVTGLSK